MACTGIHVLDPVCQAGSIAGGAADDAFGSMARSFGQAASGAVQWLWHQINEATAIDLSTSGIGRDLIATGALALILCTALFLIQVSISAIRREPGGLLRGLRGLGIATIASTFALAATKVVLAAVDELSNGVVQFATGGSIDGLGARFGLATGLAQMTNPAALLLFSLVLLAGVVMIWVALMARKMLIIVAAVLTPLAFAGGAADFTRSWVRRWIEFTAALIASKLLIIIMLLVGLSVFDGAGLAKHPNGSTSAAQASTQLATGSVLLLLAGLAPWVAIRMFHFAGDSLHAVHQQAHAARAGTQAVVAAPRKVTSAVGQGRALRSALPVGAAAGAAAAGHGSSGVAAPSRHGGDPPSAGGGGGGGSRSSSGRGADKPADAGRTAPSSTSRSGELHG